MSKNRYVETLAVQTQIPTQLLFSEYDDVMLGNRKNFSAFFMGQERGDTTIKEALKYVFEHYLNWTHQQVRDCLTPEIVARMKLDALIRRLDCPPEVNLKTELYYVAWALYPETRNITDVELINKVYSELMSGKISKYPKFYFETSVAHVRAGVLLRHMINEYLPAKFSSVKELYEFFSNTPLARKVLITYRLGVPLKELYDTPLDYLHDSLSSKDKSEELYQQYLPVATTRKGDILDTDVDDDVEKEIAHTVSPQEIAQAITEHHTEVFFKDSSHVSNGFEELDECPDEELERLITEHIYEDSEYGRELAEELAIAQMLSDRSTASAKIKPNRSDSHE